MVLNVLLGEGEQIVSFREGGRIVPTSCTFLEASSLFL